VIWCVEDDGSILDVEVYALRSTGLDARGFSDGSEFWAAIQGGGERPELVLLDVMLPGIDGVELLRRMKAERALREIPVIMATAKGAEYDKVQSLDLGADDYLVKPFGMLEMVSRVRAVLRRCGAGRGETVLRVGALALDVAGHTVTVDGARVELTYKEFELLRTFLARPGTAFTREQLFAQVWGSDWCGETRTLDMHVRTLRQKLGRCGRYIETVRGVGYRLEEEP